MDLKPMTISYSKTVNPCHLESLSFEKIDKQNKVDVLIPSSIQVGDVVNRIYLLVIKCFQHLKNCGLKIGHQFRAAVLSISKVKINIHVGNKYQYLESKDSAAISSQPLKSEKEEHKSSETSSISYVYKEGSLEDHFKKGQTKSKYRFPGEGQILGKT